MNWILKLCLIQVDCEKTKLLIIVMTDPSNFRDRCKTLWWNSTIFHCFIVQNEFMGLINLVPGICLHLLFLFILETQTSRQMIMGDFFTFSFERKDVFFII